MYLFQALRVPAYSATVDSISAGEALVGDAKLVSSNGRYALGFYNPGSKSGQTPQELVPRHIVQQGLAVYSDMGSK